MILSITETTKEKEMIHTVEVLTMLLNENVQQHREQHFPLNYQECDSLLYVVVAFREERNVHWNAVFCAERFERNQTLYVKVIPSPIERCRSFACKSAKEVKLMVVFAI